MLRHALQPQCNICDVYENDVEDQKSGQLINGKAIQSLAESISYITSVISQLQGNSEEENSDCREVITEKPTAKTTEYIDYGNSDITESPIVKEQLVHSSENNRDDFNSSINRKICRN